MLERTTSAGIAGGGGIEPFILVIELDAWNIRERNPKIGLGNLLAKCPVVTCLPPHAAGL